MNLESITAQLANRINQPHVIEIYLKKVAYAYYKKGQEDALNGVSNQFIPTESDINKCPKCNSDNIVKAQKSVYKCQNSGCGAFFGSLPDC